MGAWEPLRGAKRSLALLKPGTVLGNWLQPQLRRRPPGATRTRGEGGRGKGVPGPARPARATRPRHPPMLLASPAPRGGCLSQPHHRPVPVTTRWPLSVPRLIRPGRGVTCVPGRPPGGAAGGGADGGKKGEGVGGGDRRERGVFCGRGRRRRLGEPSARGRAGERDSGGCGGGGGGRDRRGGGRARRKPESAGGPVAGPGPEPGRQRQRSRRGRRRQRRRRGPVSVRSGGQRARAGGMEPQHVRPVLGARSPAWEEPVGTAPAPTPPACPCSLPPPPGPGSVQEAVRDEVPSCFPAGAALPPAPGLLLARRRESLCPVGRSSSPRGLWRRSFEDRFRASSFSQLCTSFPSVARRPQEWRRRACLVSGWRREETGLTS